MKEKFFGLVGGGCLLAVLLAPGVSARQITDPTSANPATLSGDQYRIGVGDILSVRVVAGRLVPEFTAEAVEVNGCGRIPLISVQHEERSEIQAAGRTTANLAEELRQFYTKYKRNPQVVVTVKEYNSQPVTVNGAVVRPGQFQLRRPVRLLELVQRYSGGTSERAGGRVQVARIPPFDSCSPGGAAPADEVAFLQFNLSETLSGVDAANPYLHPGDVVTVLEAKEAYLVGNILRPGPVLLNEQGITVSRAIAMAGGVMPDTKKERVRVIRQDQKTGQKSEIFVDLKAIDKRQAEDLVLMPNDIIDVPVSGGRRILRSLVSTVVPTIGQLPVQVIR
jgi:polysaccharide export outer membrane protein